VAVSRGRVRSRRKSADAANFRKAAEAALRDAKPQSENGFKNRVGKRCLTHALRMATTG